MSVVDFRVFLQMSYFCGFLGYVGFTQRDLGIAFLLCCRMSRRVPFQLLAGKLGMTMLFCSC